MVALTAGTASSRRFRFVLMALALDVGAVASFALSLVVAFTSGVTTAFLVLAFPVPLLATLAALAASIRSLSESKERLAKFVASALAVVSGLLLCWWGVVLLALLGGDFAALAYAFAEFALRMLPLPFHPEEGALLWLWILLAFAAEVGVVSLGRQSLEHDPEGGPWRWLAITALLTSSVLLFLGGCFLVLLLVDPMG